MTPAPPTNAEKFLLAEIRLRESADDYLSPPRNPPYATASGAYEFIRATWAEVAAATGVGRQYEFAYEAPAAAQDANALWLLRAFGANSSHSWRASGPYPSPAEIEFALAAIA